MIEQGEIARTNVIARNRGSKSLLLTFVPTCACLTVSPIAATIAPRSSATFALSFDSKDDYGITKRGYIVKSDVSGTKPLYYLLSGVVRVDKKAVAGAETSKGWAFGAEAKPAVSNASGSIKLQYYYTPGCRSCEEFISVDLPRLEARYGLRVNLERRDLLDSSVYEELAAFASSIGTSVHAIPTLRFEGVLLQGDEEIRARLPGLLATRAAGGSVALAVPATRGKESATTLSIFPVIAAGLIDGVNPCAFTTLIFLLASLALAGRGRREVLAIGALFSLGVFLTYFGIGLGLFAALRAASAVSVVSVILRWALFAFLVVFAALSIYDFAKIRAGRASEMILQLPDTIKLKIHASIRTRVRTAALAGSSFGLGFLVSIFEFACTAQVYLPTLAYLARGRGRSDAMALLVLYNLCFIAPLLAVFAASYLGVSSKRIGLVFQKRMGAVKLALAAAFLGLAVLTLIT